MLSLSARRAWIEMPPGLACSAICTVALRKESVDRNAAWTGVLRDMHHVALRKESVDRNPPGLACSAICTTSLSARRAWIEITVPNVTIDCLGSLSARRAWIEIGAGSVRGISSRSRSPQGERG